MSVVREDEIGVYINSGGYIARPVNNGTRFKKGDKIKGHHYTGCPLQGVGKDDTCDRGEYLETWVNCGTTDEDKTWTQRQTKHDWYMDYAITTYPTLFKETS